jgi:hypothetical protein
MPKQITQYFAGKKLKPNPKVESYPTDPPALAESYFSQQREAMVAECIAEGMPEESVRKFLQVHGIAEDNIQQVRMSLGR